MICLCWCIYNAVRITRHNLPQKRLVLLNGSQNNGSCQDLSSTLNRPICTGTSVLNDGIIPDLVGVGQSNPQWASELFTLSGTITIRLSFELDSIDHDRMELAVFNYPAMSINLPMLNVYFDSSFRPDRVQNNDTLGLSNLAVEAQIMNTSCDHLLVFCVKYHPTQLPTQFINFGIPHSSSGAFMFLGEVTFLMVATNPATLLCLWPSKVKLCKCRPIVLLPNVHFLQRQSTSLLCKESMTLQALIPCWIILDPQIIWQ